MTSLIYTHFPIVRFEPGERKWFNPVMRIRAADRPEERVRLRMIEFLVREAGFSQGRITTELPIPSRRSSGSLRADILCFDELLRPLLLVECKSERVRLDENAAMQAARYNASVRAPYIMLTNGIQDYLFAVQEDGGARYAGEFGGVFPLGQEAGRSLSYWQERGMWGLGAPVIIDGQGNESNTGLQQTISEFLNRFWRGADFGQTIQYVAARLPQLAGIPGFFARVYRDETGHHAIATVGDASGKTWLVYGKVILSINKGAKTPSAKTELIYTSLELKFEHVDNLLNCRNLSEVVHFFT
jgi:hypothetical protein